MYLVRPRGQFPDKRSVASAGHENPISHRARVPAPILLTALFFCSCCRCRRRGCVRAGPVPVSRGEMHLLPARLQLPERLWERRGRVPIMPWVFFFSLSLFHPQMQFVTARRRLHPIRSKCSLSRARWCLWQKWPGVYFHFLMLCARHGCFSICVLVFHPRAAGHFVFYDDDDENADARCLWPSYDCRPLISIDSSSRPYFIAPCNFATNNNNFQQKIATLKNNNKNWSKWNFGQNAILWFWNIGHTMKFAFSDMKLNFTAFRISDTKCDFMAWKSGTQNAILWLWNVGLKMLNNYMNIMT